MLKPEPHSLQPIKAHPNNVQPNSPTLIKKSKILVNYIFLTSDMAKNIHIINKILANNCKSLALTYFTNFDYIAAKTITFEYQESYSKLYKGSVSPIKNNQRM